MSHHPTATNVWNSSMYGRRTPRSTAAAKRQRSVLPVLDSPVPRANKGQIHRQADPIGSNKGFVDPLSMRISLSQELSREPQDPGQMSRGSHPVVALASLGSDRAIDHLHSPASTNRQQHDPPCRTYTEDSGIHDLDSSDADSDDMILAVASTRDVLIGLEHELKQPSLLSSSRNVSPSHPSAAVSPLLPPLHHHAGTSVTQMPTNPTAHPIHNLQSLGKSATSMPPADASVSLPDVPMETLDPLHTSDDLHLSALATLASNDPISHNTDPMQESMLPSQRDPHAAWTLALSSMAPAELSLEFDHLCTIITSKLSTFDALIQRNQQFYSDIALELSAHRQRVEQHGEWLQMQRTDLVKRFQFINDAENSLKNGLPQH
ncbi:hypothetical protein BASA61_008951 [Batrachochytrium salamandrivorans]|nr:hypothetical protein BASA61_008951 [Batrachochytrium salamandrivorans]